MANTVKSDKPPESAEGWGVTAILGALAIGATVWPIDLPGPFDEALLWSLFLSALGIDILNGA